jgi:hypothetical protein
MPNWCDTIINIYHKDNLKLNAFHNQICNWVQESDDKWLGDILIKSGIAKNEDDIKSQKISCRGYITDLYHVNDIMTIVQEDAWSPNVKVWQKVLEKFLPDACINVTGIEPGNGIFESTDTEVIGTYVIDYFSNDENNEKYKDFVDLYQSIDSRFKSENEVIALAKTIEPCNDINEAVSILNKSGCITCDMIEEVDLDSFD